MPVPETSQESLQRLADVLDAMDHGLTLEIDALREGFEEEFDREIVILCSKLVELRQIADETSGAILEALYPEEFEPGRRSAEPQDANVWRKHQEEDAQGPHVPT